MVRCIPAQLMSKACIGKYRFQRSYNEVMTGGSQEPRGSSGSFREPGAGLLKNGFSEAFSDLLDKSGVTCYKIAQWSGLDQAYLSRLKSGEKKNPSFETIIKICLALAHCGKGITLYDIEELLNADGRSLRIKA